MSRNAVYQISWRYSIDYPDWDKERKELQKWLRLETKVWIFQLEVTEILDPTEELAVAQDDGFWSYNCHFQGYAQLKTKERTGTLARRLNGSFRGIEISPASNAGKEALRRYVMKEDSRLQGPWADHPIYMGEDLPRKDKLWEWQQEATNYCLGPVKHREILWVSDPTGNSGKSMWRKFMGYHYGAARMQYDSASNLIYQATQEPNKAIFIVNLTRAKPQDIGRDDMYAALESIKDGDVRSNKYEGKTCLFMPPHVVVLSNQLPDYTKLSKDRFRVWQIENNKIKSDSAKSRRLDSQQDEPIVIDDDVIIMDNSSPFPGLRFSWESEN